VGAVFLYFGALKLFPGLGPAEDLVLRTIDILTFGVVPGRRAVFFTGALESALGLMLLTGRQLRVAIYLQLARWRAEALDGATANLAPSDGPKNH